MTSTNPTTKLYSDSGQSYDSIRTDSGFLSGANLVSEENLSCEDLSATGHSISSFDDKCNKKSITQLDSGVDISLQEQFSGLSLQQATAVNDLIQSAKSKHLKSLDVPESNPSVKSKNDKCSEIVVTQPWELYFQQDEEGDTQLHIAVIQGFMEVVYSLIKMVPHPCFLDILNDVVQSPLHLAVLTHQPQVVRRLVVAGANVESLDRNGNTPLHLACQLGDIESVKCLTEPISLAEISNANLLYSGYTQQVPQDFEEKNYDGETCLHLAAYGGHLDVLRHLIWFGANINSRENKSGRTILHHAVETLNYKLLQFLLEECTFGPNGLKVDTPNYAGHTPYQIARVLDLKVAEELINRGAKATTNFDEDDEDDEDHPDHNSFDEEMTEAEMIKTDIGDHQHNREALKV